jgi:flavin-dependent dehydrogenase
MDGTVYDAAVIGAGPAGATFARQAAAGGKKILLADGMACGRSAGHGKPCGGLLAPDAQKVLANFDLVLPKDVLADPQIFSVKTIDLACGRVRYYRRCYLNMDRSRFDRWLVSLVPAGADVVAAKCTGIERQGGLFRVTLDSGGERSVCLAKNIVGADGAGSMVRRVFFGRRVRQYTAIQQWFRITGRSDPFYSCIFDPETSESCSWMIYKDEFFIYGGCFEPKGCREAFARQRAKAEKFLGYSFGEPVRTEACLADRPRRGSDFITGRDGVYLIGEAAGFISPSSFEGISSAILSGSLLARAFRQGPDERVASRYRRLTRRLRLRLMLKTCKRWFMYTPWVREKLLRTGIGSIEVLKS